MKKTGKENLPENMQIIQYVLSQIQYFEVIIDKDQDDIVVNQKTYWPDIENYYMLMKKRAIPGLKCGYSEGFYVQAPQFDKILFEMVVLPGKTRCIMTSI